MNTEDRVLNLPKWAQDHIAYLKKECDWYRTKLLSASVDNASIFYYMGEDTIGLPDDSIVTFVVNGRNITVQPYPHYLYIICQDAMRIEPAASNTAKLWTERYKT